MGRIIHYNLLLNFPRTGAPATGRFQDTSATALLDDNSKVWAVWNDNDPHNKHWDALPPLRGGRPDSVKLRPQDHIYLAIGEKYPLGTQPQLTSIQVAVAFGRSLSRGATEVLASPFGAASNPVALFLGQFPTTANPPGMTKESYNYTDKDNSQWTVDWYIIQPGSVTDSAPAQAPHKYTFLVGAIAQTASGTYTFAHDPEVDVGTEQALGVSA
ncbi:MAG: hypothetical protein U0R19_24780 [Bryobacteraceae bacterium]